MREIMKSQRSPFEGGFRGMFFPNFPYLLSRADAPLAAIQFLKCPREVARASSPWSMGKMPMPLHEQGA